MLEAFACGTPVVATAVGVSLFRAERAKTEDRRLMAKGLVIRLTGLTSSGRGVPKGQLRIFNRYVRRISKAVIGEFKSLEI